MDKDGELITRKDASAADDHEARKKSLIRQGDFYRSGIIAAKANIKQGARPENIFHNAMDHATFALRTRVDGLLRPTGINVGTVMPYVMSVMSFINRRRLHKPAIGVAALAAAAAWYVHRQRSRLAEM